MTAAQEPRAGEVLREIARMRDVARDWRRPSLAQVEGPNDLKIYGGTIADDIDRWADLLAAQISRPSESSASVSDAVEQACGLTAKDALAQPAEALAILRGLNAARVLVVWADGSWREMGVLDIAVARDEEGTIVAEIPMSELGRTQDPARDGEEGWVAAENRRSDFDALTVIAAHLRANPAEPYSGRQCEEHVVFARDKLYAALSRQHQEGEGR